jgi:hypothetical protein
MPLLSVFFIRTALIYLSLGFTFGGLMLFNKGITVMPAVWSLLPAHIEFLLIGWTIQLILGVAFWILPRFSRGPTRGKEEIAWLSYFLINAGIWMDILSPLFHELPWLPFLGRLFEVGAAVTFAGYAWGRVKPTGA